MKTGPAKIKKHRYGVSPATHGRRRIFARVTVARYSRRGAGLGRRLLSLCEKKVWATEEHPEIVRLFPAEGGRFVLNEWKQLLRPVQGGGEYECIGRFPGLHLRFDLKKRRLFKKLVLDPAVCEGLKPGDEWKVATRGRGRESVHHEVGVRVHFDRRDRVLRREEGGDTELPPRLLEAFREATPHHDKGNCYVNEYGIIFLPPWEEEGRLHPVFVAQVDVDEEPWFDRPETRQGAQFR